MPIVDEVAVHPGAAAGAIRQREGRSDMGQVDRMLLTMTGGTLLSGGGPALANAKDTAHPVDRGRAFCALRESKVFDLPLSQKRSAEIAASAVARHYFRNFAMVDAFAEGRRMGLINASALLAASVQQIS
ncbi:hypothetical protein [Jannaschia sp. 2305UL9-9]|uniref:hypothetical protein n=1 Tax=Jannaschia sp. 2305UL9-9 TaxID=3121638 RepID=UPI003526C9F8